MSKERQKFSHRLTEAMRKNGYDPRPNQLMLTFNSRYKGPSISLQTAYRWLTGQAIPRQDKLIVLAMTYGVDPHFLRYGDSGRHLRESDAMLLADVADLDRRTIHDYLALRPEYRQLVGQLISALLHGDPQQSDFKE